MIPVRSVLQRIFSFSFVCKIRQSSGNNCPTVGKKSLKT